MGWIRIGLIAVASLCLLDVVGPARAAALSNESPTARLTAACRPANTCCRVCSKGKACGNTCIAADKNCHKGQGCACDEDNICSN